MLYLVIFIDVQPKGLDIAKAFVTHYKSMGVDKFFFILNGSEEDCINFISFLETVNVNYFSMFCTEEYNSVLRNEYVRKMVEVMDKEVSSEDWIFTLDADEFFVYPNNKEKFFSDLEEYGYEYIVSYKLDMINKKGLSVEYIFGETSIMDVFPYPTLITQDIMKAKISKIPLSKYRVKRNNGANHNIKNKNYRYCKTIYPLRHFKFYGNIIDEVNHRYVMYKEMYSRKVGGISTKYKNYKRIYDFLISEEDLSKYIISLEKPLWVTYNEKFQLKVHYEDPKCKNIKRTTVNKFKLKDFL